MERELAGWLTRQIELADSPGEGGRVAVARHELKEAECELERVDTMWRQLERLHQRQEDLSVKMAETKANGEVLLAEAEELTKLIGMADRSARLEAWIEEIRREQQDVRHLREKHSELQTRLDELDSRFRGAPDKLSEMLDAYNAVRSRETAVAARWAELNSERVRKQDKLESLKRELAECIPFDVKAAEQKQNELRLEIAKSNQELTELLRGRIELIRLREGIKQQLSREYASLTNLNEAERLQLQSVLQRGLATQSPSDSEKEPETDPAAAERERQIVSLKATIKDRFSGFERLRASAPEQLREYYDMKRVLNTLTGDWDGLRNRIAMLKRKSHPGRNAVWSSVAGILGFSASVLIWSWDIGLFAALTASGLTSLIFFYIHRGVEMELESASAAEAMIGRRVEETRATKTRLEHALGPLATAATYDTALRLVQEYRRLSDQLTEMESSPVNTHLRPQNPVKVNEELPGSVAGMPLPVLQRLFSAFCEAEQKQVELEEAWRQYEPEGAQGKRIRAVEDGMQELQAEYTALLAEQQAQQNMYESRRSELAARINEIEAQTEWNEEMVRLEKEWSNIREEMAVLESASGGMIRNGETESLRSEWNEREAVRHRLREIRNQLSAKQTQDELRARESLLTEEMAEMRQKLGGLDPLYMLDGTATEYAAKYTGQLRAVRNDIRENEACLQELQRELDAINPEDLHTALEQERSLEELQAVVVGCRERLETLERDLMTTRELTALITDEIAEKKATLPGDLSAAIDRRVQAFTDGRCLGMEERDGAWFADMADGSVKKLESLSDGTRDLLALAVRLAALDVTVEADRYPVIWDEPLWRLDERNLNRIRTELEKLARTRQVILLTRSSAQESWGLAVRLEQELRSSGMQVVT